MREIFKDSIKILYNNVDERQSRQYGMVSFDVPEGVSALKIILSRKSEKEAQIPVAFFDSNGDVRIFKASEGFSGSGSESYEISTECASAGAIKGAIPCGKWKLLLYKRRFFEDILVNIIVEAEFGESHASTDDSYSFMTLVKNNSPGWYKGELHVHSRESTGRTSVEQVLSTADKYNLDFIALTDHFTASHWARIEECYKKYNVLPIASMEVSGDNGHANVHNIKKWINPLVDDNERISEFLDLPVRPSMESIADKVHAEGGIFGINHPLSGMVGWHYSKFPMEKCDLIDAWATPDEDVSMLYPTLWDGYLSQGYRLIGVGSSDSHNPDQVDGPWTFGRIFTNVYADSLDADSIVKGLKRGRVYVSMGSARMDFTASYDGNIYHMGDRICYHGGRIDFDFLISDNTSGNLFVMVSSLLSSVQYVKSFEEMGEQRISFSLSEDDIRFIDNRFAFIRLEFYEDTVKSRFWGMAWKDHKSMRLLSNPIWIDRGDNYDCK